MKFEEITLSQDFEPARDVVVKALADEGFGIISQVEMHVAFKEKLGIDFPPYTILGACNPGLAHTAVTVAPAIGLLLPCNVTVEQVEGGTLVRIPDAEEMLGGTGISDAPELKELATDAGARLARVVAVLRG